MNTSRAVQALRDLDHRVMVLSDINSVLSFDMETAMPEKAVEGRGEQMAAVGAAAHTLATGKDARDLVSFLGGESEGLGAVDAALVRKWSRFLSSEGRLPVDFVERESKLMSRSQSAWVKARAANDFASYAPVLEEVVAMMREKAELMRPGADPYDTLLDHFEEGMDSKSVQAVFDPLEKAVHKIMDDYPDDGSDDTFLFIPYDKDAFHKFCLDVIGRMGFEFDRGAVAISAHPFTSALGMDDVRITTRYTDPSYFDSLASIVHECGHALYDMRAGRVNPETRGTSVARGESMSVHESQSRFWENMMLRSLPFIECIWPGLVEAVPELGDVSPTRFWRAVNKSRPSAIRVNADELTYPLHIIMRFRLESALVRGELKVADLPAAWNEASLTTVRYEVRSDSEGCLQDVHWPEGLFGYFPSYAMGSIAAASFMKALEKARGGGDKLASDIREGRWDVVTSWQEENIWRHGSTKDFGSLVRDVTGAELDVGAYTSYLEAKHKALKEAGA